MRLGVVLLPNPDITSELLHLAAELVGTQQTLHQVSTNTIPHMTIAHFECVDESISDVRENLRDLWKSTLAVRSTGIKFKPEPENSFYVPEGGVYFGVEIAKTQALLEMQKIAIKHLPKGVEVLTGVGESYDPHITLGVFASEPSVHLRLPESLVAGVIECSASLGIVGDYGTIPHIFSDTQLFKTTGSI